MWPILAVFPGKGLTELWFLLLVLRLKTVEGQVNKGDFATM